MTIYNFRILLVKSTLETNIWKLCEKWKKKKEISNMYEKQIFKTCYKLVSRKSNSPIEIQTNNTNLKREEIESDQWPVGTPKIIIKVLVIKSE